MNLPTFETPTGFDAFDWMMFGLRVAFIALIYVVLYQIGRVSVRELIALGRATPTEAQREPRQRLANPNASLEVLDAAESSLTIGDRLPVSGYTTIGRRDDNSIVIDDSFVSGSHAELVFDQGRWYLQDLGSTNGTMVNSQPVHGRYGLSRDDIVTIGRVHLRALL